MTDEQVRQKRHLAECRDCYEKFCVFITLNRLMGHAQEEESCGGESGHDVQVQSTDIDAGKEERQKDVCLLIQMAGAAIFFVQAAREDSPDYWNFIRMPMAATRGSETEDGWDTYISLGSEHSKINGQGEELLIQLDEDVFPVARLGIRYKKNGMTVTKRFAYNEDTESYEVQVNRKGLPDDLTVEIIRLEDQE